MRRGASNARHLLALAFAAASVVLTGCPSTTSTPDGGGVEKTNFDSTEGEGDPIVPSTDPGGYEMIAG